MTRESFAKSTYVSYAANLTPSLLSVLLPMWYCSLGWAHSQFSLHKSSVEVLHDKEAGLHERLAPRQEQLQEVLQILVEIGTLQATY